MPAILKEIDYNNLTAPILKIARGYYGINKDLYPSVKEYKPEIYKQVTDSTDNLVSFVKSRLDKADQAELYKYVSLYDISNPENATIIDLLNNRLEEFSNPSTAVAVSPEPTTALQTLTNAPSVAASEVNKAVIAPIVNLIQTEVNELKTQASNVLESLNELKDELADNPSLTPIVNQALDNVKIAIATVGNTTANVANTVFNIAANTGTAATGIADTVVVNPTVSLLGRAARAASAAASRAVGFLNTPKAKAGSFVPVTPDEPVNTSILDSPIAGSANESQSDTVSYIDLEKRSDIDSQATTVHTVNADFSYSYTAAYVAHLKHRIVQLEEDNNRLRLQPAQKTSAALATFLWCNE